VAPLDLPADQYVILGIDAVDLKNRLCNIRTDCRDRLHGSRGSLSSPHIHGTRVPGGVCVSGPMPPSSLKGPKGDSDAVIPFGLERRAPRKGLNLTASQTAHVGLGLDAIAATVLLNSGQSLILIKLSERDLCF
jgi:hypothetical protein